MTYDYYVLYECGDERGFSTFATWREAESFAAHMGNNGYYTITTRQCAPALEPVAEGDAWTLEGDNADIYRPWTMAPSARAVA